MSQLRIALTATSLDSAELRDLLRAELADNAADVRLQMASPVDKARGPMSDPAVLVAVVTATSAVVAALVSGLFRMLAARGAPDAPIVITAASGASIQVPAGTSPEEMQHYLKLLQELDRPRIHLNL